MAIIQHQVRIHRCSERSAFGLRKRTDKNIHISIMVDIGYCYTRFIVQLLNHEIRLRFEVTVTIIDKQPVLKKQGGVNSRFATTTDNEQILEAVAICIEEN